MNQTVTSGWNYWDDRYVHKHSGWEIKHAFFDQYLILHCASWMYNADEDWFQTSDCGVGGQYLNNGIWWISGETSYLFADSFS